MSTQIFVASTAFGLATVVAALADGAFEDADRRVLVVSTNTLMPEATPSLLEVTGVQSLLARFDDVYDYNDAIEPQHPSGWGPRAADLPILSRHFKTLWRITDDNLRVIVESIQVNPAQAVCRIFGEAPIDVYADGLMIYGPTRTSLPAALGSRVERLIHLDLAPGVVPMLLREWSVPQVIISSRSMRSVVAEMLASEGSTRAANGAEAGPSAMIVGQYLAANALITDAEEVDLYASMISCCADEGFTRVTFKPHPSAPATQLSQLHEIAGRRNVELVVANSLELAETAYSRGNTDLVVGCFSTALVTAHSIYELPIARYGTELLLERLTPYENSNRIPVTIVDALARELGSPPAMSGSPRAHQTPAYLNALVVAISYAMQPELNADRRTEAVQFLAAYPVERSRYVKRRRLTRLALPGSVPPRRRSRTLLRRIARPLVVPPLARLSRITRQVAKRDTANAVPNIPASGRPGVGPGAYPSVWKASRHMSLTLGRRGSG